jgi:hypothetical protein
MRQFTRGASSSGRLWLFRIGGANVSSMVSAATEPVSDIGPHEDRELELMLAEQKPLAMFTEISPAERGLIPEAEFAPHVASGRFVTREVLERMTEFPDHQQGQSLRRVLYALPSESWRIDAMLLVCRVAANLRRWDEGIERVIGELLGYDGRQIDAFVKRIGPKRS